MGIASVFPPRKRVYERQAFYEVLCFFVALLGFGLQIYQAACSKLQPDATQRLARALSARDSRAALTEIWKVKPTISSSEWLGWIAVAAGIVGLFVVRYCQARAKDAEASRKAHPEGLLGCVHVLYSIVKSSIGLNSNDGSVRITVFRLIDPVQKGGIKEVEQIMDYVGPKKPAGSGRRFPTSVGVVGYVARTGQPLLVDRVSKDSKAYQQELIRDWGFDAERARKITRDRLSFLAVPIIGSDNTPMGVIYADSSKAGAFNGLLEPFVVSSAGITAYLQERFE